MLNLRYPTHYSNVTQQLRSQATTILNIKGYRDKNIKYLWKNLTDVGK